jgi:hypothetical protein
MRLLYNFDYLNFDGMLMVRPRLFTLGEATMGDGDDAAGSTPPPAPPPRARFRFRWDAREALRLPDWAVWLGLLGVFGSFFDCNLSRLLSLCPITHYLSFLPRHTLLLRNFSYVV